jgi:hypothetical protein
LIVTEATAPTDMVITNIDNDVIEQDELDDILSTNADAIINDSLDVILQQNEQAQLSMDDVIIMNMSDVTVVHDDDTMVQIPFDNITSLDNSNTETDEKNLVILIQKKSDENEQQEILNMDTITKALTKYDDDGGSDEVTIEYGTDVDDDGVVVVVNDLSDDDDDDDTFPVSQVDEQDEQEMFINDLKFETITTSTVVIVEQKPRTSINNIQQKIKDSIALTRNILIFFV